MKQLISKIIFLKSFTAMFAFAVFISGCIISADAEEAVFPELFPDAPPALSSYIEFLKSNPGISNRIEWFSAGSTSSPGHWDKLTRLKFYEALESVDRGSEASPISPPHPYIFTSAMKKNFKPSGPSYMKLDEMSCISLQDARDMYFRHVARALKLEIGGTLPWSLTELDPLEADLLFSPENMFVELTRKFACAPYQLNWNPDVAARFLDENNIIGDTQEKTIYALAQWFRENVRHYYYRQGESFPDVMERMYGRPAVPTLEMLLAGVKEGEETTVYSIGCPGASWLFREFLRAANIPVRVDFSKFMGNLHRRAEFPTAGISLAHSDDVYDQRITDSPEVPINEIFYTFDDLKRFIDLPRCTFTDETECPEDIALSSYYADKKKLDLIVKYSGSAFLRFRAYFNPDEGEFAEQLDAMLTGVQIDRKTVVYGRPFFTAEERARIIKDVDDKIFSLGRLDWQRGIEIVRGTPPALSLRNFHYRRESARDFKAVVEGMIEDWRPAGVWKTWLRDGSILWQSTYHALSRDMVLWERNYEDGKPFHRIEFEGGRGMITEYGSDGKTVSQSEFKGNCQRLQDSASDTNEPVHYDCRGFSRHGIYNFWYPDGKMKSVCDYRDDLKNGSCANYLPGGQKGIEAEYRNGRLNGKSIRWYENGNRQYEKEYSDGVPDGKLVEWYEDGVMKESREYSDGKLDGTLEMKNEAGVTVLLTSYREGREHGTRTEWNDDGTKTLEAEYRWGKLDGLYRDWYANGGQKSTVEYKDGKRHGFTTIYDMNGKIVHDRLYKNGVPLDD